MLRSLHRKLVLILVLLIIALMAVVGAFLINGVVSFYTTDFSAQMWETWSNNSEFYRALRNASEEPEAPDAMGRVMSVYAGTLGIDARRRNYYILDGTTAQVLESSDPLLRQPDLTPNLYTALSGENGTATRVTNAYLDVAVPIGDYIVYVRDNKEIVQSLTAEMFMIILEAVLFGLVISILLSFLLSKTMTTPLEGLTRGARQVASGNFSHMLEVHSADEIGVLTRTFNNMAGVLRDTLEAIGSERDKLGTLFLHMTDGVVAFASNGDLMHINPAAERMLGVSAGETLRFAPLFEGVAGWDEVQSLTAPEFLEKDMTRLGRSLKLSFAVYGESPTVGGLSVLRGAQEFYKTHAARETSGEGGKQSANGVMIIVHDVTEQQHLEEVRREFVSNVSHELRTPLTNIKSYAETLCEDGALPQETVRSFSQVIVNEADRMTRIVRDLLTLSRFDYGKMDWNMGLFNVGDALQSVYDATLLEAKRQRHGMTLEFRRMPSAMWGDRGRVEQVLINIISNAINYTPPGGMIDIGLDMDDAFVIITVTDNGVGIPPDALPRLFDRFYRVDKHRSRASGGTGLGLAITKEIVEHLGGDIHIASTQGKGTTVTVRFPLTRPAP